MFYTWVRLILVGRNKATLHTLTHTLSLSLSPFLSLKPSLSFSHLSAVANRALFSGAIEVRAIDVCRRKLNLVCTAVHFYQRRFS